MKNAIFVTLLAAVGCGGGAPPSSSPLETPAPQGTRLAAGGAHSCMVEGGRVHCWGANDRGQLGDGSERPQSRPTPADRISAAVEVAAGDAHTCARSRAGEIWCWGAGLRGQIGDGREGEANATVARPVLVPSIEDAVAVVAGAMHTCALGADGAVRCWGDDAAGQLGDGEPAEGRSATPVTLELDAVTRLAAGRHHTCAVDRDGAVWCWGAGTEGQLGNGATGADGSSSFPVRAELPEPAEDVTAGRAHTCALTSSGRVYCWGADDRGQLGRGAGEGGSATPLRVEDLDDIVSVRAGAAHTCARMETGAVLCWGANASGQLGDGTHADAPRPVSTGVAASEIATGEAHTCARQTGGAVVCWGDNRSGQLGDGRLAWRAQPAFVDELWQVQALSAGGHHTCAMRDRAVLCWGDNGYGQLGDMTHTARSTPVPSVFAAAPQQVTLALGRTCVRDGDGAVSCLGFAAGAPDPRASDDPDVRPRPVALGELGEVVQIAAARDFACALSRQGAIHCWGDNARGQLGDGTLERRDSPSRVRGAGDAREIAVGVAHACARLLSGAVYCWGANELGQLGDGTQEDRSVPTEVVELEDAEQLALGRSHSCARRRDGTAACWGGNAARQIGDGSSDPRVTPTAVRDLDGVEEIAAGWLHTCARTADGVRCWGENRYGQLGQLTEAPFSPLPVAVEGLRDVESIATGGLHTCARLPEGRVACWGANTHGQLGDGVTLSATRPVLAAPPTR